MTVVYDLWFEREYPDRENTELHIGIYASEADAAEAIDRLHDQPGFREFPQRFNTYPVPAPIALGRDVRRGALVLGQLADTVSVVGLVGQHDGMRAKVVEQRVGDLPVMGLPGGQAEPDRETLRIDDDVDLGREPAA